MLFSCFRTVHLHLYTSINHWINGKSWPAIPHICISVCHVRIVVNYFTIADFQGALDILARDSSSPVSSYYPYLNQMALLFRIIFYPDFADRQLEILVDVLAGIVDRHTEVKPAHIIGHGDITVQRKIDLAPVSLATALSTGLRCLIRWWNSYQLLGRAQKADTCGADTTLALFVPGA